MHTDVVERWTPSSELRERPAESFDLSWQGGQQRLVLNLHYAADAGEDDEANALIVFHDVFAFQVFDEDMDGSVALKAAVAELTVQYSYGGRWPFLEVKASSWVDLLVKQHGSWTAGDFRHFIVTSRNMHLHVACRNLASPAYLA